MPRTSFARTGIVSPFGKYDASIKEFRFPSEAKDILQREASALGIDLTTFVRDLLLERALGADHLLRLHRARYLAVAGKSANSPEGGE